MKSVLFYCDDFYPKNNGYANAYINLINSILANYNDIHITVVTSTEIGNAQDLCQPNLKVIRIKKKSGLKFFGKFINEYYVSKFINRFAIENKTDMIFVETFDQPFMLSLLSKKVYDKMAVRIHSTSETEYTFFIRKFIYVLKKMLITRVVSRKLKWVVSTNSFHIDFAKKYYFKENLIDIGNINFFIIPNTIYPDSAYPIDKYQFPNKIKAVILGRMEYEGFIQKGFIDLFIALNTVSPQVLERFEITVVGQGAYRHQLEKLSAKLGCVEFVDSLPHEEIIDKLLTSDLVILPSRFEGLSMFALEGLACGNMCLFSRTGGLTDLIDGNGFFTEVQDINSIRDALTNISSLTPLQINDMKERSVELYNHKFKNSLTATAFMELLQVVSIISGKDEI